MKQASVADTAAAESAEAETAARRRGHHSNRHGRSEVDNFLDRMSAGSVK